MKQNKEHAVDFIFILALFFFFAVAALAVIVLSLQSYRSISQTAEENYASRTCVSYLSQKLRHMDTAGAISLSDVEGQPAIKLSQSFGEAEYSTYIYSHEGQLTELFVQAGTDPAITDGRAILPIQAFEPSQLKDGLFKFLITDDKGLEYSLELSARS